MTMECCNGRPVEKGFSPDNPARIYCDGIFDLFHFGHAKALEQAKKLRPFTHLIVGVCNDTLTNEKKGKTVLKDYERYESVRHCRWVDEVIENAPWIINESFLREHKIDYVAHDEIPYKAAGVDDVYKFVKDSGRFLATHRTEGISTSDMITRIVRDYNAYLLRNIEQGVSPRELNISKLKEGELKMKQSVRDFTGRLADHLREGQGNIIKNWEGSTDEFLKSLDSWELKSQEWMRDFVRKFRGIHVPSTPEKLRPLDQPQNVLSESIPYTLNSTSPLSTRTYTTSKRGRKRRRNSLSSISS